VREADFSVLRNNSDGAILCARDQPQQVRNDVRSRLQCLATCTRNDQCSSFNYKNTVSASGPGYKTYTCEHFDGYPFNFTVDPTCSHYAVCATYLLLLWTHAQRASMLYFAAVFFHLFLCPP